MAYVAISKDFRDRVTYKIQGMEKAELNSIGQEPPITLSPETPSLLDAVWKEHLHLRHVIPADWTSSMDSFSAKFELPVEGSEAKFSHSFNIKLTDVMRTPPNFYKYHHQVVDHNASEFSHLLDWVKKKQDINARWQKVLVQVQSFLENCKSANEAVKLWPDVKMYFDAHDIQRLETKTERSGSSTSNAAQVLAQMDVNELTGAAVIARMSGAV